jgi:hypothetical protein
MKVIDINKFIIKFILKCKGQVTLEGEKEGEIALVDNRSYYKSTVIKAE